MIRGVLKRRNFVEIEIPIDVISEGIEFCRMGKILFNGWQSTQKACDRRQFGRGEKDISAIA